MNEKITYFISIFLSFFAVMNPVANTPIFLGVVGKSSKSKKRKIAKTACITAFLIVTSFTIAGKYIFDVFHITIPAFKITGGVLIFYVGFQMLMSQKSKIHESGNTESDENMAISPLAIPILAGPGTIVTAMNSVTDASFLNSLFVIGVFGVIVLLTYLCFISSDYILEKLGKNIIDVIGKLMGLLLAIIGCDMLLNGVNLYFK